MQLSRHEADSLTTKLSQLEVIHIYVAMYINNSSLALVLNILYISVLSLTVIKYIGPTKSSE